MSDDPSPAARIDAKLAALGDWRAEVLMRIRMLIHEADPEIIETVKWIKPTNRSGVPAWEHDGIVCTGEVYAEHVKLTFARGAALDDAGRLFNAGLGGGTRRAIDIRAGESVAADPFKALVREAVAFNIARSRSKRA